MASVTSTQCRTDASFARRGPPSVGGRGPGVFCGRGQGPIRLLEGRRARVPHQRLFKSFKRPPMDEKLLPPGSLTSFNSLRKSPLEKLSVAGMSSILDRSAMRASSSTMNPRVSPGLLSFSAFRTAFGFPGFHFSHNQVYHTGVGHRDRFRAGWRVSSLPAGGGPGRRPGSRPPSASARRAGSRPPAP